MILRMENEFKTLKQELKIRGFTEKTRQAYLYHNQKFLGFCQKKSDRVVAQDVKDYLEYLIDKKLARDSVRLAYNALLFYYIKILKRQWMLDIKIPKKEKKEPVVLTASEMKRLVEAIQNPKHRQLVELAYASGVRVSELVKFKVKDILTEEKIAVVRGGKGKKDRKVILSDKFLADFKGDLNEGEKYLFPGRQGHLTIRSVQVLLKEAAKKAGIKKRVYPHLLRHSFATHLVEKKVDVKHIQKILGHAHKKTTERYLHLANNDIRTVKSPHDCL